jgi:uncharacterized protein (TIGR02391 family)
LLLNAKPKKDQDITPFYVSAFSDMSRIRKRTKALCGSLMLAEFASADGQFEDDENDQRIPAWDGEMSEMFSQSQIEAIANALGDTSTGLTGTEIGFLLSECQIVDSDSQNTKRIRLYNAFVGSQKTRQDRGAILCFIRKAMKPERYTGKQHLFEPMRANLNLALAFCGLAVDETGKIIQASPATTLSEATRHAKELRADMTRRGVHEDVLRFCRAELVQDNYFHAVLEATKSIADKIRTKTGLTGDGALLVDAALCGQSPKLAINPLTTDSHRSEQSGFANLVKGTFGMFRNTTGHEARILWDLNKEDAEDLLSLASLIHRRLNSARVNP